jgi:hypothetical protein
VRQDHPGGCSWRALWACTGTSSRVVHCRNQGLAKDLLGLHRRPAAAACCCHQWQHQPRSCKQLLQCMSVKSRVIVSKLSVMAAVQAGTTADAPEPHTHLPYHPLPCRCHSISMRLAGQHRGTRWGFRNTNSHSTAVYKHSYFAAAWYASPVTIQRSKQQAPA